MASFKSSAPRRPNFAEEGFRRTEPDELSLSWFSVLDRLILSWHLVLRRVEPAEI